MNAFSAMLDQLFADPNMAQDAIHTRTGEVIQPSKTVRAVIRQPDVTAEPFGQPVSSASTLLEIRVAEVPDRPASGDTFRIGAVTYTVQGTPQRDPDRLVWTIETRPGA